MKVGIISDTHNYLDEKILAFFEKCNEIWHAGDIGSIELAEKLAAFKPLRAVYGNIDGQDLKFVYPKHQRFVCAGIDVFMIHIGGYPGKYEKDILRLMQTNPPKLFVCGHSHILKVIYDKKFNCLHINPGAAGKYGFHLKQTAIRFDIENEEMKNLEIFEKER